MLRWVSFNRKETNTPSYDYFKEQLFSLYALKISIPYAVMHYMSQLLLHIANEMGNHVLYNNLIEKEKQ